MSPYSSIIRKLNCLEAIKQNLPPYELYFKSERTNWLTPAYLEKKLAGTRQYFDSQAQLGQSFSKKTLLLRQKRHQLEDLTRAGHDLVRATLHLEENEVLESTAFHKERFIEAKSQVLLTAIEQLVLKSESPVHFIDWPGFKSALALTRTDYLKEKADYTALKDSLEAEKQQFLQKEDEVDDLYHDTINTLEGALHEDRDVLVKIMPWRERKQTGGEGQTAGEKKTAEAVE